MPNRYLASITQFMANYNDDAFIKEIIKNSFRNFFDTQVSKYTNAHALPVNSVGSIGFYYKELFAEVALEKGYKVGNMIKSPIESLIKYHSY